MRSTRPDSDDSLAMSLLFGAFLLVLVWAPIPLGSNREWSWTLLSVALAALTLAWSLLALLRPAALSLSFSPVPAVLLLGVCAWAWLQGGSVLPAAWGHPLWSLAGEALGEGAVADGAAALGAGSAAVSTDCPEASVSLAPDDTGTALLRLAAYGLTFLLAFQFCRLERRARRVFQALVAVGLATGFYGLAMYFSGQDGFLFLWEMDYSPSVHGTFVNRNHFATWIGLCLLCLIALSYRGLVQPRRNPMYELPTAREERLEQFLARAWLPLAALILMTGALMLTHSRGGFLASFFGGLVLLWSLHRRRPLGTRRSRWVLGGVLALVLVVFMLTSSVLLERMSRTDTGVEGRLQAYELTADGVEDNPLLGFGYGTYADGFRLYRSEQLNEYFDKAHNTYLENLFELGWPAGLALFLAVAWLALVCLRGLRRRRRDWVYPATGLAATALVASHALVDFSLQIPATAVTYAAIMGVACAQSVPSRH